MKNIMVCVTKQINCERLIDYANDFRGEDDILHIIHVAHTDFNFLGKTKEIDALEYLYTKAMDVGAELTVEKSDNVIGTLVETAIENDINVIVLGDTKEEEKKAGSFYSQFQNTLKEHNKEIEFIEIPSGE